MLSNNMIEALSKQVTNEFYSGYFYLAIASFFEKEALPGFANWMRVQAQEEASHAMIIYNYICEHGHQVKLGAISAPPIEFYSTLDAFKKTLEHEKNVTKSIYNLMDLAVNEKDYATQRFLDWFITEQLEEENSVNMILSRLERFKDHNQAIFFLDNELKTRSFSLPPQLAKKL